MFAFLQPIFVFFLNIVAAFSFLLIGFILGKLVELSLNFFIKNMEIEHLFQKIGFKLLIQKTIPKLFYFLTVFIFFIFALNKLGIAKIFFFIFIALLIILTLAYVISYVNYFLVNFSFSNAVQSGKEIKLFGIKGKVIKVTSSEIIVEQKNKDKFVIPKSLYDF